jgi:DNA-binding MarR family transcriptional regulator
LGCWAEAADDAHGARRSRGARLGDARMHQVFFSIKRVHLRVIEIGKRLLKKYGLTPARFDMLRIIDANGPGPVPQAKIRALLGVSAATVSRMLISLEKLGFVERTKWTVDARNLLVALTALVSLVGMGRAERMARRGVAFEPKLAVLRLRVLQKHLNSMRRAYGDDSPFVHPWRADELVPYDYTIVVNGRIRYTGDFVRPARYEEDQRRSRKRPCAA